LLLAVTVGAISSTLHFRIRLSPHLGMTGFHLGIASIHLSVSCHLLVHRMLSVSRAPGSSDFAGVHFGWVPANISPVALIISGL